jgi:ketohexokinase
VVSVEGRKHSIALFRQGEEIKAFDNNCPHANVPLDSMYKIEIDPRALTVKCSVHAAFFRTDDGLCIAGPCERQSLKPTPISVDDQGWIYLVESGKKS